MKATGSRDGSAGDSVMLLQSTAANPQFTVTVAPAPVDLTSLGS